MRPPNRNLAEPRRLMMLASKAYYIEGRSKTEIATELGISRFRVARCLADAREIGMVSITVNSGTAIPELSTELAGHLGLSGARVIEVYGDEENVRTVVGRAAGGLLKEVLVDGDVLGIGWGRTLTAMFDNLDHLPQIEIVQLAGRFAADVQNFQAELIRRTAAMAGGPARVITAPFFVDDARLANALRRRPDVAAVVAGFSRLTTAVVGVGAVHPRPISVAYSAVPERFTERVLHSGGVGEVQGILFAEDGHIVDTRLGRHTLTITPDQLRGAKRVIAAAADPVKAHAVRAVCCSGVLTDVVVDVGLAHALLKLPPVPEDVAEGRHP